MGLHIVAKAVHNSQAAFSRFEVIRLSPWLGSARTFTTRLITTLMSYPLFVKKVANRSNHSVLGYLLLIYFVVYAISPLSCSYTVSKIADSIYTANGASGSETKLDIFLLKVICARIDAKKNVDQANSRVMILIRKARAILPENANSVFAPLGILILFAFIALRSDNSSSRLSAYLQNVAREFNEFNPLHSGPAPPSL